MVMGSVTTVLITGITGTVGVALAQHLSTIPNVEIHGLKRIRSDTKLLLSLAGKITLHEGDMTDAHTVMRLIKKIRPDRVYHLAAQSYPSESWNSANFTLRTNIEGTTNLLEALKEYAPNCRTHIAGSSAQYGKLHPHEIPVKENHPMSPVSPYGVSKVTQELLGRQYFLSYNMFVVVTRSFNLIGPQGERCAVQGWCKQVAMIEAGLQPPVVMVGDLSPQRDFTHVRDVAEALWLLLERGVAGGVYNLCTGKATQMQSVLNMIISQSVLKDSIKYEVDPALLRPVEEPILTGDVTAIKNAIGWEAKIGIQEMVKEILDYWRGRISVCGTL